MNGPQPSAAFAAEVTLAWDASSSSGVTGYRVYYGTASGNYPYYQDSGNRTTYTLANLNAGTTYYLAVSAMNSAGLISDYSNEVVYTTATGSSTGSGGSISGQIAQSATAVTLSTEGTTDWVHWGLTTASSLNRKSGATQQISSFTLLGSTSPYRFSDGRVAYSWTGGTSTASASSSVTGLYFTGVGNGYRLTVPAGTTDKTLKLYLGLWRARGKLEAKLSDGSAASFVTYPDNSSGILDRVVTLTFRAASSGVNLIIDYTLENNYGDAWGNITLMAATLAGGTTTTTQYSLTANVSGSGSVAKNPNQTQFASGTAVQLTATPASGWTFSGWSGDLSGSTNPATITMNGNKTVTATFTQTSGGGSSSGSGGSIGGQVAQSAAAVTLSTEGTSDWANWGLTTASSLNRKSGVTQQISNYTLLGSTNPSRFADGRVAYSWTGGTSTASASSSKTGIYFIGVGNGYRLTVPAGTTAKTLKLYLGLWRAKGKLEAKLSDGSAASYVTYLDNSSGILDRVVTLTFRAASSSANLIIDYTLENNYGDYWGNITLMAATLVGGTTTTTQYSLTANVSGSGSVVKNPNQTQFTSGTSVQLTASPASGWAFSGWSGDLVGNANPATITMNGNKTITATFTQGSGGSSSQASELVGYWKFDEGTGSIASDGSGYGNTGTLSGASWTASGKKNGALALDGVNDRVEIPNSASLASTSSQITVAAWVYLTDISNEWITVMQRTDSGGDFLDFQLHARGGGAQPLFMVDWNQNGTDDAGEIVLGDIVLSANRWYFLTATYDGSALRFYIDGTLRGTQAKSGGTIPNSGREIWIGGNDVWGEFLKGRIDEVRIYNRALSATEIQTLYAQ